MINDYRQQYLSQIEDAMADVDLDLIYVTVRLAALQNLPILVMGNGGSCAVAEHLSCDFTKGIGHDSPGKFPRVHSLVSNQSLITAIANDYGYDQIFSKQIEYFKGPALVIAISSSGNSENIIKGLEAATAKQYPCIALVGFTGGRVVSNNLATFLTAHVKSNNYGVVEDSHSIIMHCIAQQLRLELSSNPEQIIL